MKTTNILRIDASMRREGSHSRQLADRLIEKLQEEGSGTVVCRDLSGGVDLLNEAWITANSTDSAERSDEQRAALAQSDILVAEVKAADTLVLAVPIYNFSIPAAMKAWIDQICRARETFAYTPKGPRGLLRDKKAFVIITSGGTAMNSDIDYASGYLRHVLRFIGIEDVSFIGADQLMKDEEGALARAEDQIRLAA